MMRKTFFSDFAILVTGAWWMTRQLLSLTEEIPNSEVYVAAVKSSLCPEGTLMVLVKILSESLMEVIMRIHDKSSALQT